MCFARFVTIFNLFLWSVSFLYQISVFSGSVSDSSFASLGVRPYKAGKRPNHKIQARLVSAYNCLAGLPSKPTLSGSRPIPLLSLSSEAELLFFLPPPPILPNPRPPRICCRRCARLGFVSPAKMLSRISRLGVHALNQARLGDPSSPLHRPLLDLTTSFTYAAFYNSRACSVCVCVWL